MYDLSSSSFLKSSISQKEQFSNGAILKWSISQMEHFSNGAFLEWSNSQIKHFSNGAFLKWSNSQIEHFSNGAFLKWSNSQIEHFSNGAIWGRHHQLDDSLVGQLTSRGYTPQAFWDKVRQLLPSGSCSGCPQVIPPSSFKNNQLHFAQVTLPDQELLQPRVLYCGWSCPRCLLQEQAGCGQEEGEDWREGQGRAGQSEFASISSQDSAKYPKWQLQWRERQADDWGALQNQGAESEGWPRRGKDARSGLGHRHNWTELFWFQPTIL